MTTVSRVEYMPGWERPTRIPESVPIEHSDPPVALAGEKSTWRLPFRLTEHIAPGITLRLQLFGGRNNKGGFRNPQVDRPGHDGYVTAEAADGVPLPLQKTEDEGTFLITTPDSGLEAESTLTVTVGDRSAGGGGIEATCIGMLNSFFVLYRADSDSPSADPLGEVWSEVTQHQIVGASTMHIVGSDIDHLRAYVSSQVSPGEPFSLVVRPEDEFRNLSHQRLQDLAVFFNGQELQGSFEPVAESTCVCVQVEPIAEGTARLTVKDRATGKEATTNPTICTTAPSEYNLYWGMIHGHTEMSDGTGTIEHYFRQMRDEAALDFAATGDHDHLRETSDTMWETTCEAVARWNQPGEFVTFLGYEWAKWRRNGDGDRNVYYLEDYRPMYRSDWGEFPRPPDLFEAISDETAIVIPHHTGHAGNFCDFKHHDPEHERLIEIFQVRGSYENSEEDGNPVPECGAVPPNPVGYISRALAMGWRVGFTAGGDDHVGHAGTDFPQGACQYKAGLMGVLTPDLTREAIWEAMWNRRVIATTGPRMILRYELNGSPMGSELNVGVNPDLLDQRQVDIEFHGTAPVQHIDIIRNNQVIQTYSGQGLDCELSWQDDAPLDEVWLPPAKFCPHPFCFYYVRVVQSDGEVAWASPIWLDAQ